MIIFKETLRLVDEQIIALPEGSKVLSAQFQETSLKIWYYCDPKARLIPRTFFIFGTGNPIDLPLRICRFVASVQRERYVWHVFEEAIDLQP